MLPDLAYISNVSKENGNKLIKHLIPRLASLLEVLFLDTSFGDNEFTEIDFLHSKFVKAGESIFSRSVTQRRGTTSKKKNGVISVLKGVPLEKKVFWKNIYCNEKVLDLATSRDADNKGVDEWKIPRNVIFL